MFPYVCFHKEKLQPKRWQIEVKKGQKKREMANKASNFSHLIHRVAASCLSRPHTRVHELREENSVTREWEEKTEREEEDKEGILEKVRGMEGLMAQVFDAVSSMTRAYVSLQAAQCTWETEKVIAADVAVVGELKKLTWLMERFGEGKGLGPYGEGVVGPYEATVDFKEMLPSIATVGKKVLFHPSQWRISCSGRVSTSPTAEIFHECMREVREDTKSFTTLLLSFMRSARWDITAAVRSIVSIKTVQSPHHAVESYINRTIYRNFHNETFGMDHPVRHDRFAEFKVIKSMGPTELIGAPPTSHFGKFCMKKYLAVIHPSMEESLLGSLEHRRLILAGTHPRTEFYAEFVAVARSVWMLHQLAFALDPTPTQFEANQGAEFHPEFMESVVRFPGQWTPVGQMAVGFPISPGFELGNGDVVKARVYAVSRT
ncbi:protein GRAVITROPIC IN THE LIGHT 1-like isoform X2 [Magnolia sinica]|uniref:protein GRAVITROPIC IN THE LIGHT 1-like isoform X2 n=1 Tax=Magnolia sinica TaxID=86752 RepID=UPI00265855BB|nr:protein GRAVITROPIC IN THE LIGHT 1-like isoform X2 [Magnolia sinica]